MSHVARRTAPPDSTVLTSFSVRTLRPPASPHTFSCLAMLFFQPPSPHDICHILTTPDDPTLHHILSCVEHNTPLIEISDGTGHSQTFSVLRYPPSTIQINNLRIAPPPILDIGKPMSSP